MAMINQVLRETYRYAQKFTQANTGTLRPHSVVHKWKPTNAHEMKISLGL